MNVVAWQGSFRSEGWLDLHERRRSPRHRDNRRWMPGHGEGHRVVRRVDDGTRDRRKRPDLEVIHLAVDEVEHALRRRIDHRVRAQRTADASHHDRRVETVTGNVADDDPQLARRQREEVIPIAADRRSSAAT